MSEHTIYLSSKNFDMLLDDLNVAILGERPDTVTVSQCTVLELSSLSNDLMLKEYLTGELSCIDISGEINRD